MAVEVDTLEAPHGVRYAEEKRQARRRMPEDVSL